MLQLYFPIWGVNKGSQTWMTLRRKSVQVLRRWSTIQMHLCSSTCTVSGSGILIGSCVCPDLPAFGQDHIVCVLPSQLHYQPFRKPICSSPNQCFICDPSTACATCNRAWLHALRHRCKEFSHSLHFIWC